MIPQEVYDHIRYANNVCHGAELKRGNKTYSLKKGYGSQVKASLFVFCKDSDLPKFEKKGYQIYPTSAHSPAFAYKKISISSVPDSVDKEWKCWDEY